LGLRVIIVVLTKRGLPVPSEVGYIAIVKLILCREKTDPPYPMVKEKDTLNCDGGPIEYEEEGVLMLGTAIFEASYAIRAPDTVAVSETSIARTLNRLYIFLLVAKCRKSSRL
jgi:hypothetical protein